MGISRRNPRGNFNWQYRMLRRRSTCCGNLNEPFDCEALAPTLVVGGTKICLSKPQPPVAITCTNTQPTQAAATLYEWYFQDTLVYSSMGPVSTYNILVPKPDLEGVWTVVATNVYGCVTEIDFDVYVTQTPAFSVILQTDATTPCVAGASNGVIEVSINDPDPNALYYGYVLTDVSTGIPVETTSPLTGFVWNTVCNGVYDIKVRVYRLINGVPTLMCTTLSVGVSLGSLILEFDNIANAPVANPADPSQWTAWWFANPVFTSAVVVGNLVYLKATNTSLIVHSANWGGNTHIVSIIDESGYIGTIDNFGLSGCSSLVTLDLVRCGSVGTQGVAFASSLTNVYFRNSSGPNIDDFAFQSSGPSLSVLYMPGVIQLGSPPSPGNNNVFLNVTGNTIAVTADSFLQTNNAGGLDGDLAYLNANNTVTFTWV